METLPIHTGQIRANNHLFTYLEAGSGPLVLLLHGFPDNPHTFGLQLRALAAAGYHAVAPYKRGFDPNDDGPTPLQHSALYTQDVLALVEALKAADAILIGHDWGAGAAYGAAQVAPEKIKAIVTMAIPLSPAFFSAYTTNLTQMKRSWYLFFFQSPYAVDAFKNDDYALIDLLWKDWSPNGNGSGEHLQSVKQTFRQNGAAENAVTYYRQSFGTFELTDPELQEIQNSFSKPFTVPTLYIHGQQDGCIGVENTEGMEQLFTGRFEKHVIEGSGHFVHLEKPEEVNKLIVEFLRSLE